MNLTQEAKSSLSKLGVHARKKWGQNFMVSVEALTAITDALKIVPGETVLEIGPGLGFLTRNLLSKACRVIAVEYDPLMIQHLQSMFSEKKPELFQADFLKFDFKKELSLTEPVKVAGNIPYNITSPILERLIEQREWVSEAVLTVQKEVAQRLASKPGTKQWSALSIFAQVYAKVEVVGTIGKESFFPAPKVDSAIVKFVFSREPLVAVKDSELFFQIVRKAFQKRRKTILNALADESSRMFAKALVGNALRRAEIDPIRRPETLSLEEWALLSDQLALF